MIFFSRLVLSLFVFVFCFPFLVCTVYQLFFDLITSMLSTSKQSMTPSRTALCSLFSNIDYLKYTQLNNLLFKSIILFSDFASFILTVRLSHLNASNRQCSPLAGRLTSGEFYLSCSSPIFGTVRSFLSILRFPLLSLSRRSLIDSLQRVENFRGVVD